MIDDTAMDEFIQKVARSAASNFPSYVDAADVASELWCFYMEKEKTLSKMIEEDESWERKLFATMTRVANEYLLKEDAAVNGYSPDDVYHYSSKVVKELLKDAFDYEDWQSFSTFGDGQPKSKGLANQTGDRMAMLADVKAATEKLAERQYNIILWVYKYGYSMSQLGEELGIAEKSARNATDRAVEALRKKLGRTPLTDMQRGWSGRVERPSNVQARAAVERDYSG